MPNDQLEHLLYFFAGMITSGIISGISSVINQQLLVKRLTREPLRASISPRT